MLTPQAAQSGVDLFDGDDGIGCSVLATTGAASRAWRVEIHFECPFEDPGVGRLQEPLEICVSRRMAHAGRTAGRTGDGAGWVRKCIGMKRGAAEFLLDCDSADPMPIVRRQQRMRTARQLDDAATTSATPQIRIVDSVSPAMARVRMLQPAMARFHPGVT